ncbi:type 1 glutamine amidotransferase domain-containing protein [Roseomonas fluvialis]|uniref:Dimethylallyltransferase n=1 Tax=Roseomonas fluvialis TaxID=1750527 RepID=A0ABN6P6U2_9PROT|nr:type 1 glutamine amidotransferase domain-containing protein [Roseomonas fluvialis]BDG74417.1 dimethylallyltransferase [Roseomonas fluvialis]
MTPRILIVLTSHRLLGQTGRATGFHFEELATPYWAFRDAGFAVEIASIQGGAAPVDPGSHPGDPSRLPASVARFLGDQGAIDALATTAAIDTVQAEAFDGVFLPGGHGTMWDLPTNAALARLVGAIFDAGGAVGAVCHGPAGLVGARRADGRPIVEGRRVNSFTNAEEAAIGLTEAMPFLLETRLTELGGRFEGGPDFRAFAVRDGNLVTGQNPASAGAVAAHVVDIVRALGARAAA